MSLRVQRAACLAAFSVLLGSSSAEAGPSTQWFQVQELSAPDAAGADGFGTAIAISNGIALIGAPGARDGTPVPVNPRARNGNEGAAYVYFKSGTQWIFAQKLTAPTPVTGAFFGASVALSDGVAFIGAAGAASSFTAYVFRLSAADGGAPTFSLYQQLAPSSSVVPANVALSNGLAVVGTTVYSVDPGSLLWAPQDVLSATSGPLPAPCASSAFTTAAPVIAGTSVLFGGSSCDFVFDELDAAWILQQGLPPGLLATAGNTLALASSASDAGAGDGGAGDAGTPTFTFTSFSRPASGGAWVPEQPQVVNAPLTSAAMTPGAVLFAAYPSGVVYPFVQSGTTWEPEELIQPSDQTSYFGSAVAVEGDSALIGADRGLGVVYAELHGPANGDACASDDACGSTHCVGGVCCGTECSGGCQWCPTGTCEVLALGAEGACAPLGCNGVSSECPTFCTNDDECPTGSYCTGADVCAPKGANGAACTAADQCAGGPCVDGTCHGPTQIGRACDSGLQCASTYCVDGYCCDTPCDGQCQACDVQEGTCTLVSGAPHGNHTPCAGTGVCAGVCDGAAEAAGCSYPTVACGTECTGNTEIDDVCNGEGECVAGQSHSCGNLVCAADALTCLSACEQSADCQAGFRCSAGDCLPGGSFCLDGQTAENVDVAADGGVTGCTPYACLETTGQCQTSCVTVADCAPHYACDPSEHRCIVLPSTDGKVDAGCSCRVAPGTSSTRPWPSPSSARSFFARDVDAARSLTCPSDILPRRFRSAESSAESAFALSP